MRMPAAITLAVMGLVGASPTQAAPPDAGWNEVAAVRDGACRLTVTGNGRFYRIAATGLEPGAAARYVLANGDMKPLDWRITADAAGGFARYYVPFRWHRTGDTVAVALTGGGCDLSASFAWTRAGAATS